MTGHSEYYRAHGSSGYQPDRSIYPSRPLAITDSDRTSCTNSTCREIRFLSHICFRCHLTVPVLRPVAVAMFANRETCRQHHHHSALCWREAKGAGDEFRICGCALLGLNHEHDRGDAVSPRVRAPSAHRTHVHNEPGWRFDRVGDDHRSTNAGTAESGQRAREKALERRVLLRDPRP